MVNHYPYSFCFEKFKALHVPKWNYQKVPSQGGKYKTRRSNRNKGQEIKLVFMSLSWAN